MVGTGVLDGPDASSSLAASDVAGVALLGIQGLYRRIQNLEQQNKILVEKNNNNINILAQKLEWLSE